MKKTVGSIVAALVIAAVIAYREFDKINFDDIDFGFGDTNDDQ